jgi:hypothetical protein
MPPPQAERESHAAAAALAATAAQVKMVRAHKHAAEAARDAAVAALKANRALQHYQQVLYIFETGNKCANSCGCLSDNSNSGIEEVPDALRKFHTDID